MDNSTRQTSLANHTYGVLSFSNKNYRWVLTPPSSATGGIIVSVTCPVRQLKWTGTIKAASEAAVLRALSGNVVDYKFYEGQSVENGAAKADFSGNENLGLYMCTKWHELKRETFGPMDFTVEQLIQENKKRRKEVEALTNSMKKLTMEWEAFQNRIHLDFDTKSVQLDTDAKKLKGDLDQKLVKFQQDQAKVYVLELAGTGCTNNYMQWKVATGAIIDAQFFELKQKNVANDSVVVKKDGWYHVIIRVQTQLGNAAWNCTYIHKNGTVLTQSHNYIYGGSTHYQEVLISEPFLLKANDELQFVITSNWFYGGGQVDRDNAWKIQYLGSQ